jgi:hypothetical protein
MMNVKKHSFFILPIILLIVQLACNAPSGAGTPDTAATLNGLYTASAQTLEALGTQTGFTATPGLPLPTSTGSPLVPAFPTNTPFVQQPGPVSRCDAAAFVSDVSYPDGTAVSPGGSFVKTWRLKNVGTCSWTTSYALVFFNGDAMNAPSAVALAGNVNPGQTADLSVTLVAPNGDGKYRGYWKLRNASNGLFGIGAQANTAFWVDIKVSGRSFVAYDFVANYCNANWENNDGALPCPGSEGDGNGFVIKLNAPRMEDGSTENEPGLLTFPMDVRNGIIAGQYPAITVQSGDRFRTLVNCQYNAKKCNVIFRLDYRNNGQTRTLASWNEAYEGKFYPVDLDLSRLAGETVKFILVVHSNGSPNDDEAIWLNPHILRQGSPPPTSTFTSTLSPSLTPSLTPTLTPTSTPTQTLTTTPTP